MLSRLVLGLLRVMIEFCNRRRIVICMFILGIISLLIIVAENKLSPSVPHHKDVTQKTTEVEKSNKEDRCWEKEKNVSIMMDCQPCPSIKMDLNMSYCMKTGYYEKIKCEKSKTEAFRSCPPVGWMEERKFWAFESVTLVVGLISYGVVFFRRRMLDQQLTDKINKQIASGL